MTVSLAYMKTSSSKNNSPTVEHRWSYALTRVFCCFTVWNITFIHTVYVMLGAGLFSQGESHVFCYFIEGLTYLHFGLPSWKTHDPPLRHFTEHTAGVGSKLVSQRTPVNPLGQLVTKKGESAFTQHDEKFIFFIKTSHNVVRCSIYLLDTMSDIRSLNV